ncbi:MAG: hypothetical protein ACJAV5_000672 [Vicingaceae bacterium]|jgi:hypothetical protein
MIKKIGFFLFTISSIFGQAQSGGNSTYKFLNTASSARIAALGGAQIAVKDNDPFLAFDNPSLLNKEMDNKLALTYLNYISDIGSGFASYTKSYKDIGTFSGAVKFIDYGKFTETDNAGNEIGDFSAGEYAFVIGYAREIDTNFSIGGNVKAIYSNFYDYNSLAAAIDLSASYLSLNRRFTMAMVVKNIGRQITTYNNGGEEDLPFEIQYGLSKSFENIPIRLGLVFHNLQQWDLRYDNPNDEQESTILNAPGEEEKKDNKFLQNFGRHLIVNTEFLVSENFNIRFGYNYMRRADLKIDEELGTVGFSWGLGFRVNKFHLSYGRSAFHQAAATNTFSISTRLSDFIN